MIGAIIGDIVGSVYEWNNHRSKDFPLFRSDVFFTDDSLCTLAVADCLLTHGDPAERLLYWGRRYPHLDYGGRYYRWLNSNNPQPYDSYGNGAAMRVAPAAYLAHSLEEARQSAVRVTEVTHNHPEGIKGALATTDAIWMAYEKADPETIRDHLVREYGYDMARTVDSIRPDYVFNETCQKTVPEAIICALEATDFEDAIRNAISIGGDSDTVACISGAIAEARFGIPQAIGERVWQYLPAELQAIVVRMYDGARAPAGH